MVELYPEAVAGLVAFDIWIGNPDRARNFNAGSVPQHAPVFRGFYHSQTLLCVESTSVQSLRRLRAGDLIAETHPFYGGVRLELPFRAAMNVTYLSNFERSKSNPSLAMIFDLALALEVHPFNLLQELVTNENAQLTRRRKPDDIYQYFPKI